MIINEDNYQIANDAIRDILFMYYDMVRSYDGFGHNIDIGHFNAVEFLDFDVVERHGYNLGIDAEFIKIGASIALLCELSNAWDDHDTWNCGWDIIASSRQAYERGLFDFNPVIREAFKLGFGDSISDKLFDMQLKRIYTDYVLGTFSSLLNSGKLAYGK